MPDPFRKVVPGDRIKIPAVAWNAMLDAAQAQVTGRNSGPLITSRSSSLVRIRNDSGANLGRFHVVGLDGPIFTPTDSETAFLQEVTFVGAVPDITKHRGKFAVLLEPVPIGGIARAWVAGVCPVRIDLIDASHQWAEIADTETALLTSTTGGSAQIVWCESDDGYYGYSTGEQWAIVRIGLPSLAGAWAFLPSGQTITGSSGTTLGSGTVTLCSRSGANLTADGDDVTVYNAGGSVTAGTYGRVCKLGWTDGVWSLDVFPCT